jgi:DNA-binding LacI/PurR family transcriptional regulator
VSRKPVSLKKLAEHLGLSPATVSLVINRSTVADSIPQETKDRIRDILLRPQLKYFVN